MRWSISLLLLPILALADDPDFSLSDFNQIINQANQEKKYRDSILKQDGLHNLVPDEQPAGLAKEMSETVGEGAKPQASGQSSQTETPLPGATAPAKPKLPVKAASSENRAAPKAGDSTGDKKQAEGRVSAEVKESEGDSAKGKVKKTNREKKKTRARTGTTQKYFPGALVNKNSDNIEAVSVSFDQKQHVFGISIGTSIPIKLRRTSTNVQPGYIELLVTADVAGRKKILPVDSILFARPSVVKGSSRLYLESVRGVTPDGYEFMIKGHVSDHFNTAGMTGIIKSDGRAVERSLAKGGVALGSSLISGLADDPVTTATGAAANQMIREGAASSDANLDKPVFVVSASPQPGVLTVEETF